MHLGRKAIIAAAAASAVVAGGAAAYAATNGSSTGHDPQPARHAHWGAGYGPGPGPGRAPLPAGTRSVLEQIRTAVLDRADGIVSPIIDQAVTDGKLTADQGATAKQALADLKAGKRPSDDALALLRDADARAVAVDAVQALAKQVPSIAKPILDDAVAKGTIDRSAADTIAERIQRLADRAAHGGLPFFGAFGGKGFGPGGGPFGHGGHGHGPFGGGAPNAATAGVLGDIARAVAKQTPGIAAPIIDQAVADGKLTKTQADALKQRIADAAKGAGG